MGSECSFLYCTQIHQKTQVAADLYDKYHSNQYTNRLVKMSDNYILAHFVYPDGDHEGLEAAHRQAFDISDTFEVNTKFISALFGTAEISTNDVPSITNISRLEHYEYSSGSEDIDLLYAPLVQY